MAEFPHLQLISKVTGTPKPKRFVPDEDERTTANLANRQQHGQTLTTNVDAIQNAWQTELEARRNKGLPDLANPDTIPLYLQIDPSVFNLEFLKGFGIEIISEEEEGYIIGASADNFQSLRDKISKFVNENKATNTSTLWQIIDGTVWRRNLILSKELNDRWDAIGDADQFLLEVGIACYVKLSDEPEKEDGETDDHFNTRHSRWQTKVNEQQLKVDELTDARTDLLREFIAVYGGELLMDDFINFPDSFCCRIKINGAGLKDLVINFQYLFEVSEADDVSNITSGTEEEEIIEATVIEPDGDAPQICIIDSGILEGHRLLSPAIITAKSKSYIPGDVSVIDAVGLGGHGTKVAGATLYSSTLPRPGDTIKLPFFITNARILNHNNEVVKDLHLPKLMEQILDDFHESKVFNLSVTSLRPCKTTHMSLWAAMIDKLIFERNVLFIVATGNVRSGVGHLTNPGINQHLINGSNYPDYLYENASRICNPAQSCFALTVGSVCHADYDDLDKNSFGRYGEPSSFTRIGLGLWGMIKPDVVEFGGDFVVEKAAARNITLHNTVSAQLVKMGSNGMGIDVGTSFATPKVSHIAGVLQREFPQENALMYRALIVQSARLPNAGFATPTLNIIKALGYGIPDLRRATQNTKDRITFITNGTIPPKQAHIFKIKIPNEVKRPGYNYDILVEVTLSYLANPRRTRKGTRSYLSSTADWESSKLGETRDMFRARITQEIDNENIARVDAGGGIDWKIKNRIDTGVAGVRRQDNSLQKDWAIIKSNQMPDEFCIAVIGRKGWDVKISKEIPYALTISFEVLQQENELDLYQNIQAVNIELDAPQTQLEIPIHLLFDQPQQGT